MPFATHGRTGSGRTCLVRFRQSALWRDRGRAAGGVGGTIWRCWPPRISPTRQARPPASSAGSSRTTCSTSRSARWTTDSRHDIIQAEIARLMGSAPPARRAGLQQRLGHDLGDHRGRERGLRHRAGFRRCDEGSLQPDAQVPQPDRGGARRLSRRWRRARQAVVRRRSTACRRPRSQTLDVPQGWGPPRPRPEIVVRMLPPVAARRRALRTLTQRRTSGSGARLWRRKGGGLSAATAYSQLADHLRSIGALEQVSGLLTWDQDDAAERRRSPAAEHCAAVAAASHALTRRSRLDRCAQVYPISTPPPR